MTGSEFQTWLDALLSEGQKEITAEGWLVDWERGHWAKERVEADKKKCDAHQARLQQIYQYCEVLLFFSILL